MEFSYLVENIKSGHLPLLLQWESAEYSRKQQLQGYDWHYKAAMCILPGHLFLARIPKVTGENDHTVFLIT